MEDDVKALLIRIPEGIEQFANGLDVLVKMNRRQAVAQEAIAEEMLDQDSPNDDEDGDPEYSDDPI